MATPLIPLISCLIPLRGYSLLLCGLLLIANHTPAQEVEALNEQNRSLSYDEAIRIYQDLDRQYPNAKLITGGLTDIGRPLHLFLISSDQTFNPISARNKNKLVILVNNGIHPGESDGIDASVRLSQQYLTGKLQLPANVVVAIIPVYNIDGSLHGNCCTRANQNGPVMQGFRGNARNLDLNRDFIKCDSENARSFTALFREWDPDILVDTHVSNGADYQYTMTLISTQHNKLGGPAGTFLKDQMTPALFRMMKKAGHEMSPYVNTLKYDHPPESGLYGFMETPRFATGYAALFGTIGFVPETHMLKPFPQRVEATQKLLEIIINYSSANAGKILEVRNQWREWVQKKEEFPLAWEPDTNRHEMIPFNGYEAVYRISKVTGQQQLYYDRSKPFTRQTKFYDYYEPALLVKKPARYIIPQAWKEIIERFDLNRIQMERLKNDTVMEVSTYVIDDYKTSSNPYEGHYAHYSVVLKPERKKMRYFKGDYLVQVQQPGIRYIIETLEPHAADSWFAWGFFDAILQQKEWFSAYVFDEMAEQLLNDMPDLKKRFEEKKATDAEFAGSAWAQLYYIYQSSPWFEDLKRYPIGKIE